MAEPATDTTATSPWRERAAVAWVALVLLVWCLLFHAEQIGEYRKLERRVPAVKELRLWLNSFFYRDYVY